MFTEKDISDFRKRGIDENTVKGQIADFQRGFPFSDILKPAVPGDGIKKIGEDRVAGMLQFYDNSIRGREIMKFIPASGAATRMFKALFTFREEGAVDLPDDASKGIQSMRYFFDHIGETAFSKELDTRLRNSGVGLKDAVSEGQFMRILNTLLNDMDYATLPKGLLAFHRDGEDIRLACEEHLVEGISYAADGNDLVRIHFTVSPEHKERFAEAIVRGIKDDPALREYSFEVGYSEQKPSTDTLAVDLDNQPFRNEDGSLLFRPGGHGALIENLNDLKGDIVFIKNIDNVVPDRLKEATITWKKVIGAELLHLEKQVHGYLDRINSDGLSDDTKREILAFLSSECGLRLSPDELSGSLDEAFFLHLLNRPVRVCGMVRNEGEPGGGPFWVKGADGRSSLQIVESAQIDQNDPEKKRIMNTSTHFNPVDLVCSTRDYNGDPFDLREFVDPATGFISHKSKDGRDLKALELPGLWNGAMAHWLTAFVEVPLITFNPVKTINDLLRDQHKAV